jgi:hypothetical protein
LLVADTRPRRERNDLGAHDPCPSFRRSTRQQ